MRVTSVSYRPGGPNLDGPTAALSDMPGLGARVGPDGAGYIFLPTLHDAVGGVAGDLFDAVLGDAQDDRHLLVGLGVGCET